jgi:hypothetical protein
VVGRNYITEEVEVITSSSGDAFEEKKKELRKNVKKQNHKWLVLNRPPTSSRESDHAGATMPAHNWAA